MYGLNRNKEILGQFIISGGWTVYSLNRNKGTRVQFNIYGDWTVYIQSKEKIQIGTGDSIECVNVPEVSVNLRRKALKVPVVLVNFWGKL